MILGLLKDKTTTSSKGKGKQTSDYDSDAEDDDDIEIVEPGVGWAYVGSHNFTPSAWGTLSGSGFNPVLNVSKDQCQTDQFLFMQCFSLIQIGNYELGVMFPLKDEQAADNVACWERPPKKYVPGKDEPWVRVD